jgi:hypothetical protein
MQLLLDRRAALSTNSKGTQSAQYVQYNTVQQTESEKQSIQCEMSVVVPGPAINFISKFFTWLSMI